MPLAANVHVKVTDDSTHGHILTKYGFWIKGKSKYVANLGRSIKIALYFQIVLRDIIYEKFFFLHNIRQTIQIHK